MKKFMLAAIAVAALSAISCAGAEDFSGVYVGGDLGRNRSSTSGTVTTSASNAASYGLEGGYGWNLGKTYWGVEGFFDSNQQTTHAPATQYGSNAYGLGLKIGVPIDSLMPYAMVAYNRTLGTGYLSNFNASGAYSSLGLMYKFSPSWSIEGEWANESPTVNGLKLKSNNLTFGLNYHFDSSRDSASLMNAEDKAR